MSDVIYGWSYSAFNNSFGWDKGGESDYIRWENFWARKINALVYGVNAADQNLTDDGDKYVAEGIVNEMMVRTSAFLKRDATGKPDKDVYGLHQSGDRVNFPQFSKAHLELIDSLKKDEDVVGTLEIINLGGFGANNDK